MLTMTAAVTFRVTIHTGPLGIECAREAFNDQEAAEEWAARKCTEVGLSHAGEDVWPEFECGFGPFQVHHVAPLRTAGSGNAQ